jgi:hypothetical protein
MAAEAEAAAWVAAYAVQADALKESTAAVAETAWLGFEEWYNPVLVAAMAREMAGLSTAAQDSVAGLATEFTSQVIAATAATIVIPQPRRLRVPIRNDVDLRLVHHRPAEAYKRAIATGSTHAEALVKAGIRAKGLAFTDLSLQARGAQQAVLDRAGITTFRRVIRPELSKTGTCGMCIVAADQVYNSGDLMPLHPPSCNCVVMPIIGDNDPGRQLNREDLDQLYADAGSNRAEDLRKTRYTVNQHGEFGPTLTKQGDNFRGPDKVALENDPDRAARMLAKTLPVLEQLEAAGGPEGPLAYQRDLVAKLRRIVG